MRTTRILHVINSLDIGGNERFLLQLLEHLPKERFFQGVCVPDRGKDATRDLQVECKRIGIPITVFQTAGNLDATVLLRLGRIIQKGHYDIVHTHLIYSQIYGRLAAWLARTRCVISSEQNVYELKTRPPFSWTERRLSALTDLIIACSNRVREHLVEKVGISPLKVVVVPNAVDTSVFSPIKKGSPLFPQVESVRKELGIEPGDTVIGSVGHMSRQKGYEFLVEAIPVVRLKYPRARFVLVGKGLLRKELEEQAKSLGVQDALVFAGIRNDVPAVLNCFEVFVLPSLWEGFGVAIIEALACGVPVIASRVGGIPEIIENGVDGLLVPPARPRPLAESVIRLLDNPTLRRDMIYRGLRKAVEQFSVSRMAQTMTNLYGRTFHRASPRNRGVSQRDDGSR
jgi:glycosyltransferase involved in cell wall biosynthesis